MHRTRLAVVAFLAAASAATAQESKLKYPSTRTVTLWDGPQGARPPVSADA